MTRITSRCFYKFPKLALVLRINSCCFFNGKRSHSHTFLEYINQRSEEILYGKLIFRILFGLQIITTTPLTLQYHIPTCLLPNLAVYIQERFWSTHNIGQVSQLLATKPVARQYMKVSFSHTYSMCEGNLVNFGCRTRCLLISSVSSIVF